MSNLNQQQIRNLALKSPLGLLAFGFGSGLSPWAPGTMGTLLAWVLVPFLFMLPFPWQVIVVAVSLLAGVWICGNVAERMGVHDHGGIVWDEIAAFWLCVLFIPYQWQWLLAAFVLFRFFDIIKPWPIGWADKQVSGGMGIMLDDILAAVWTVLILQLALLFLNYDA